MPPTIIVHPRVCVRHPELTEEGVRTAWDKAIRSAPRIGGELLDYAGVGFDDKGRLLEMTAVRTAEGDWLIYHAMTPPSKKTLKELGLGRSKR